MKFNTNRVSAKIKYILIAAMFAALTVSAAGCKSGRTLDVFNWGDYMDEDVIKQFEKESGIKVNYKTYGDNEAMYTKLKSKAASFDIAIPSDYMIERMIKEDMVKKLDLSKIPNINHIDSRFMGLDYDPQSEYSVPYMWGTLGILYNTTMVDEPVNSWDILWDEKYSQKIFMYDSVRDSMTAALIKLGYDINTTDESEMAAAKQLLTEQRPLVRAYLQDQIKDRMITNVGALALVYSGDAVFCIGENPDLAFSVPDEGSNFFVDAIVLLKDCKHEAEALEFINFLNRPDIMAQNAEYIGYSTVSTEALDIMPDEFRLSDVFWPDESVTDRCTIFKDLGEKLSDYNDIWTELLAK